MSAHLLKQLQQHGQDSLSWRGTLPFPDSRSDAGVVDLVPQLVLPTPSFKKVYLDKGYPPKTRYRFPEQYRGIESKEELVGAICRASMDAGFKMAISNRYVLRRRVVYLPCLPFYPHSYGNVTSFSPLWFLLLVASVVNHVSETFFICNMCPTHVSHYICFPTMCSVTPVSEP